MDLFGAVVVLAGGFGVQAVAEVQAVAAEEGAGGEEGGVASAEALGVGGVVVALGA